MNKAILGVFFVASLLATQQVWASEKKDSLNKNSKCITFEKTDYGLPRKITEEFIRDAGLSLKFVEYFKKSLKLYEVTNNTYTDDKQANLTKIPNTTPGDPIFLLEGTSKKGKTGYCVLIPLRTKDKVTVTDLYPATHRDHTKPSFRVVLELSLYLLATYGTYKGAKEIINWYKTRKNSKQTKSMEIIQETENTNV